MFDVSEQWSAWVGSRRRSSHTNRGSVLFVPIRTFPCAAVHRSKGIVEKTGSGESGCPTNGACAASGETARAMGNRKDANRTTGDMVTSKLMRWVVPILLCLLLAMGGLCGSLCFAGAAPDDAHSCCHEKNQCGHPGPTMQPHQAVAVVQMAPLIQAAPALVSSHGAKASGFLARTHFIHFTPTLRTSVLRL